MKRLLTLVRQDLLLCWRNGLIFFTGLLLLIMVALLWLLPESLGTETAEYVYDASEEQALAGYLRARLAWRKGCWWRARPSWTRRWRKVVRVLAWSMKAIWNSPIFAC